MDRVVVVVVCGVALTVALGVVLRWGGLDSSVRIGEASGVVRAVRRLCIVEVSGIVSGLLVGGFGSRLMMRIMAATSAASAQGRVTEAEEIVGKVTADGTIGLLLFVGVGFGLVGAFGYALLGRFLPRRAWASGLVFGLLVLGVFARRDPLDPSNSDFTILSPLPLAVAMIVALFLLYGMTLAALTARLERAYPPLEKKARSLVAYAPLLLLALPPLFLALAGAVVLGGLHDRHPDAEPAWRPDVVTKLGSAAVAVAVVLGNVWLGLGIADILA
jgi:hypothetical protein